VTKKPFSSTFNLSLISKAEGRPSAFLRGTQALIARAGPAFRYTAHAMPVITVDNTRLNYHLEGNESSPILIFSNSLGTDMGMWAPQVPELLPHFRILRYDTRGLGASDAPAGEYAMEQLGRDVVALTDALQIKKFAFLGLSLGGMIGQWLGANAGSRLTALVLANTSPYVTPKSNWDDRRRAVLDRGMSAIVDMAMGRFFSTATLAKNDPLVNSIRATFLGTNPVGYAGCCSAIRDMDHRPLLPKISTPTLVIGGEQDVSTPWSGHGEALVKGIPGAKSVILPTAHLSNVEAPQEFNSAVLNFLQAK
jgi:3-oxoadipate enol-lactonase